MSRNFRLLEQLENEQALLATARLRAVTGADDGNRPQLGGPAYAALKKLVQRIFFKGPSSPRLLVVTGAEARVGCTWVTANVAQILAAETANTICVLDANWAAPGTGQKFGARNKYGLSDVLNEQRAIEAVTQQVRANLFVIGPGCSRLGSPCFERLHSVFRGLRQSFDFLLIDAAPPCPETLTIANIGDGVVLVVKAGATSCEVARLATLELKTGGAKLLGTVLNQLEDSLPQALLNRRRRSLL